MSKTCSNWQKFLLSLILRWPFLALLGFYQDWVQLYWTQCDFVTLCWVKYDVNDRKHYFTSFLGGPSWVLGRLSMVEYGWVWLSNLVWPFFLTLKVVRCFVSFDQLLSCSLHCSRTHYFSEAEKKWRNSKKNRSN